MKKALETIPWTIDEAFNEILERIENQEPSSATTAKRTLTWVYYAQRPLEMEELREALVVERNDHDRKDNDNSAISIVDCCLSFITHDESTGEVRFIHPSVHRWFQRESQRTRLLPERDLAETCLTYLSFDIFDKQIDDIRKEMQERLSLYNMHRYATQFWGVHTRNAENDLGIQSCALAFLGSKNKRISMLRTAEYYDDVWYAEDQTALHIAASNGIAALCNTLLDADGRYSVASSRG
jgi:hypothetical protein